MSKLLQKLTPLSNLKTFLSLVWGLNSRNMSMKCRGEKKHLLDLKIKMHMYWNQGFTQNIMTIKIGKVFKKDKDQ